MGPVVLSLTVFASVGIGVVAASWVVNAILYAFNRQPREIAPAFIPSETHGD
jgi:hypothetical protein